MPSREPMPSELVRDDGHRPRPPSLPTVDQMRTIATCQRCGRTTTLGLAVKDEWLVARYRLDPGYWIIRCYGCISEWSLRVSAAGRTKEWREKMRRGKERLASEPAWVNPMLSPMSSIELPPEMTELVLPDDSSIDYTEWIELWEQLNDG